jgi:hypothetical protein
LQSNFEEQLEQKFSGWDITFEGDGSFSGERKKEILRQHNVELLRGRDARPNVRDFARIGFVSEVSEVDQKLPRASRF